MAVKNGREDNKYIRRVYEMYIERNEHNAAESNNNLPSGD